MRILYLECNMGAAGDMLMAALLELLPDRESFLDKLNNVGLLDTEITAEKAVKCGITGTHVSVKVKGIEEESLEAGEHTHAGHTHAEYVHTGHIATEHIPAEHNHTGHSHTSHHHSHTGLDEIYRMIEKLQIEEAVKQDVKNIYRIIADAESKVHGKPVSEIHFHEVGTGDALADITGCAMLIHELKPDRILVSPISTGYGQVHCAHGILPVPAPATAWILTGMPCKAGSVAGELCTPTGAAILKYFADGYGHMPEIIMEKIGYGMGSKDFPAANCIRAIWGRDN